MYVETTKVRSFKDMKQVKSKEIFLMLDHFLTHLNKRTFVVSAHILRYPGA